MLARLDLPHRVQAGEGAFYGPKLEFALTDRQGRPWQCGTIQFDLVMPARFGLEYVDADGERRPMVMLHRALYGSLERFLGILLEHHGPALPAWLAPMQARVLPVAERHLPRAEEAVARLRAAGLRAEPAGPGESLGRRAALAREDGVPFVAVIGDAEASDGTVALRSREGRLRLGWEEFPDRLAALCAAPEGVRG